MNFMSSCYGKQISTMQRLLIITLCFLQMTKQSWTPARVILGLGWLINSSWDQNISKWDCPVICWPGHTCHCLHVHEHQMHQCLDLENGYLLLIIISQKEEQSTLLTPRNQVFMGKGVEKMVSPYVLRNSLTARIKNRQ